MVWEGDGRLLKAPIGPCYTNDCKCLLLEMDVVCVEKLPFLKLPQGKLLGLACVCISPEVLFFHEHSFMCISL